MIILLADDERLIRMSLKSMIEELYPGKHDFIEARNGKELINIAKTKSVNLAFVDINMPLLDGLSAISQCKIDSPSTQWFILSGVAEFDFARKALALGVKDYILKPISLEDVKEAISTTESTLLKSYLDKNDKFELDIISSFNLLKSSSPKGQRLFELSTGEYRCYLFSIYSTKDINITSEIAKDLLNSIRSFIINKINHNINFTTFLIEEDKIFMLVRNLGSQKIDLTNSISLLNKSLQLYQVTALEGPSVVNLLEAHNTFNGLVKYSNASLISALNTVLPIYTLDEIDLNNKLSFCNTIISLSNYYNENNNLSYKDTLDSFAQNTTFSSVYEKINKSTLNNFFKLTMNINLSDNTFAGFINEIKNQTLDKFSKIPTTNSNDLINEIMRYVDDNYMNEIGVNTISELYGITPNYLSKIFKERSGLKFIDYITTVRIKHGKKLLMSSPLLTIKEVSELVGYHSPRHFTKQFLKIEGFYPSDLQKS